MNSTSLRIGVLGCGYWGSKHVRTMYGLPQVSSVVAIDADASRGRDMETKFPGLKSFQSLEEALPHVDAVVVATQPGTHCALALQAIAAGKHVLVEKPLAPTSQEGARIVEAAREAGVTLMVGHTFEYNPAVWKLREMVSTGELGELFHLNSARLNLGLYQREVNVVFDLAPHDISIMNYVVGSAPTTVECWSSRHANAFQEDVAYLRLHYDKPAVTATIHVSWLDPCKVRRVTAVGSQKMVVFDDMAEERVRVHDKGVSVPDNLNAADLTQAPMSYRYGDVVSPFIAPAEPLRLEDEHFVECCLTGETPVSSGESGLAVVKVLEASSISAREGRPVSLTELTGTPEETQPLRRREHAARRRLAGAGRGR